MRKNIKFYIGLTALSGLLFGGFLGLPSVLGWRPAVAADSAVEAKGDNNIYFHINLDHPTIAKGYTVAAFDDRLKLSLVPGILSEATAVDMVELHENLPMPWRLDRLSGVYQFEFRNKAAYDDHHPFYIQFAYDESDMDLKQVFFYDKNFESWRPLPTRDFPEEKFVRSLIHLPYARIAVFSHPGVIAQGRASWYGYKGGDFAASPDFPAGSRLRVHNTENGKFVDVVINDYGPNRSLHPNRALDLDKIAFQKLAPLSEGMIDIRLEPLSIAPAGSLVLGIPPGGVGIHPAITASSTVIFAEDTGEVIWSAAATSTRPLASLTKIVAAHVFLSTGPDMDRIVAYNIKDAEYNYEWCEPWESGKLSLKDGETLMVRDLFFSSLVGSTNNTVETLVRISGLSRPAFIARMNETVASWGAVDTFFVEPTGLAPENVSSALDYAIITKEAMKNPLIVEASRATEYSFTTVSHEVPHRIRNTNTLVRSGKYAITGSKTGYLHEAGYCLMTRVVTPDNRNLVIVSLGVDDRAKSFREMEDLIQFGLRMYDSKNSFATVDF